MHILKPNIELFRNNNAKWIFEQHSNNPSELFELRSYLTAQLLWQSDADADSIMDDFLDGYYDDNVYFNNPIDFMQNANHPAIWDMKIVLGTSKCNHRCQIH